MEAAQEAQNREAFRQAVVNTLERRLFYIPSFIIYRGVAGLYDYGPPGCAVKSNVLAFWRQYFVLEENMLEVDCPCVTPEVVLKASGHVDKFTDLMVKDEKTGTCYCADHLLKDFCKEKLERNPTLIEEKTAELRHVLAVLDDLSSEELGAKIKKYGITAPDTKNPLSVKVLDWGEYGVATTAETASLRASFRQEVAVWHKLDHPNVTKFVGASMGTSDQGT